MSKIDDELAALKASHDATVADVQKLAAGITSLNNTIGTLTAQLSNAGLSTAQQAALDGLVTQGVSLKGAADAAVAELPAAPAAGPSA